LIPPLVLLFAWAVQFGPDIGESIGWNYFASQAVAWGAEAALLWGLLALWMGAQRPEITLSARAGSWCARLACWGCAIEGAERAGCRLAFPMDRPPPSSDVNICDLATGLPMTWLSISAAMLLACLAVESTRR